MAVQEITAGVALGSVVIKDIRCTKPPSDKKLRLCKKQYFFKLLLGGQEKRTKNAEDDGELSGLQWNASFVFHYNEASTLRLALYRDRTFQQPDVVGEILQSIRSLIQETPDTGNTCTVSKAMLPEVHPYAKVAYNIIFAVYNVIENQLELDENMQSLFSSFSNFYEIVQGLSVIKLQDDDGRIKVSTKIGKQLIEVAYFVCDYCNNGGFARRVTENLFSDTKGRIQEFSKSLKELKDEFYGRGAVQTEIKVTSILQTVEHIDTTIILDDLPVIKKAVFNSDKTCLPGTRREFLAEIVEWILDFYHSDTQRVLFLLGGAGTGKSSIANTVVVLFKHCLGATFYFSRNKRNERTLEVMFPHIARGLTDALSAFRAALVQTLREKSTRAEQGLKAQFEKFILGPLNIISDTLSGPIVIIIDALDEGRGEEPAKVMAWRGLLEILITRMKELPRNVRILVTSRPEKEIGDMLCDYSDILVKRMDRIPSLTATNDIILYVKSCLSGPSGVLPKGITTKICDNVVTCSHGLFQWASVACSTIRNPPCGSNHVSQYRSIVLSANKDMYYDVLSSAFPPENELNLKRFRLFLSHILVAFEPLSVKSFNKILLASGNRPTDFDVAGVISYLGSVLSGANGSEIPIRRLHTLFRDFLTDESRSGQFFVDLNDRSAHLDMACASLDIVTEELTFNTCSLESSYIRNKDIPHPKKRIAKCTSPQLFYLCQHWGEHYHLGFSIAKATQAPSYSAKREELGIKVYKFLSFIGSKY